MPQLIRRYTFKLYPNPAQDLALREQARMCALLWNGLLEMRETFYRRARQAGAKKTSLTAFDQGKDITALRAALPEWRAQPRGAQERVADMLDRAFKAFFRRAKAGTGEAPGYPRFKSVVHADAVHLREPAKSCWRMTPRFPPLLAGEVQDREPRRQATARSWTFTLPGVGALRARGEFPAAPTAFKTADIRFEAGAWRLSLAVAIERDRAHGGEDLRVDFDLIDEFARVSARADGPCGAALTADCGPPEGEFPHHRQGLPESSCAEPADAGEVQASPGPECAATGCAEPADAGEVQDKSIRAFTCACCAEPADAGEVQEGAETRAALNGCAEPADAGEVQAASQWSASSSGCAERADAGEVEGPGSVDDAPICCAKPADAGEAQIKSVRDRRFRRGSKRWRREHLRAAKLVARVARQRRHALHLWSTALIARAGALTIAKPPVAEARTGRGDKDHPGAQVATIAALNRRIRAYAPAMAIQMLKYKAAEAGIACETAKIPDHPIRVGVDLKAAAITHRRARRTVQREKEIADV